MEPWLVALFVFVAYGALLILLGQTGILQRLNVQAAGPLLVWRTTRGRTLLEFLARPRRVWRWFADASLVLVLFTMVGMMFILTWIASIATQLPVEAVDVTHVIGLPAVNPLIPLWYGIFGLAVAILVHEGCHGILARAEGIQVKSVGLLFLVVPIGAFVEPDEREMRRAPLGRRLRIFAVGPASNLFLAAVCGLLFSAAFVGSLQPVDDGVFVNGVEASSPAFAAGLLPGSLIDEMEYADATRVDITNSTDFTAFMKTTAPGDNVTLHLLRPNGRSTLRVELGAYPIERQEQDPTRTYGFLGVTTEDPRFYLAVARPGERMASLCQGGANIGSGCIVLPLGAYLQLPIFGLSPLPEEKQWLYQPAGAAAALDGAFWLMADGFYWLFWLNFMVGTFNALPLLPLDGGHMYKDVVLKILRRRRGAAPAATASAETSALPAPEPEPAKQPSIFDTPGPPRDPTERLAHRIAVYTSFYVLAIVLWQFIGPRVGAALGA